MKDRTNWAAEAVRQLGIEIDVPFTAVLSDGTKIDAMARVRNFGAKHGMLIVPSTTALKISGQALLQQGYGYVVMDNLQWKAPFDPETDKEMLADWGWSGDPAQVPKWLG